MAVLKADIERRAAIAARIMNEMAPVRAAYVFGSHAEGRAHRWSDVDVAFFLSGLENWDAHQRARALVRVQKEAGMDIEAHLFPAESLDSPEPASFVAHILSTGAPVYARR